MTKDKEKDKSNDPLSIFNPLVEAKESLGTTLKLLISALTLVSALAWNDAIKSIFEFVKELFPANSSSIVGVLMLIIYAVIVTIITVFLIRRLENLRIKILKEKERAEEE